MVFITPSAKVLSISILCALSLRGACEAQAVNAIDLSLGGQIDRIARQVLQQTGVPSASIAVVQHGKLVYLHAYGKARLQPPSPSSPTIRYFIGSFSK